VLYILYAPQGGVPPLYPPKSPIFIGEIAKCLTGKGTTNLPPQSKTPFSGLFGPGGAPTPHPPPGGGGGGGPGGVTPPGGRPGALGPKMQCPKRGLGSDPTLAPPYGTLAIDPHSGTPPWTKRPTTPYGPFPVQDSRTLNPLHFPTIGSILFRCSW
jgi:hypothetical protein